jgi:hypothetical protein
MPAITVISTGTVAPLFSLPPGYTSLRLSQFGVFPPCSGAIALSSGSPLTFGTAPGMLPIAGYNYCASYSSAPSSGLQTFTISWTQVTPTPGIRVSKFFTDSSLNPLPLDSNGNPKVDAVLSGGIVTGTNPGQVLAWVNVTNTSGSRVQSLKLNDTLPVDWTVNPPWMPALGAIHIFFANTTSLLTNPEITQPSTVTVSSGNPQTVHLAIPSFNATGIGHPLMPGQSMLLSVKLSYGLKDTSQSASSYPRNYTDTATGAAWTQASFIGTEFTGNGSAFFTACAKVLGDVNGDFKVDILDAALLAHSFGAKQGDPLWIPSADFNNDGVIDIGDAAVLAFYFGTSS